MDTTEQILKYCPKSGLPNILRPKSLLRSLQGRPRWVMLSGGTFDFHFVTPGWSPQADQIFSYVTHVFCSFSVFSPPQLYGAIDSIALMPSSTALVQSLSLASMLPINTVQTRRWMWLSISPFTGDVSGALHLPHASPRPGRSSTASRSLRLDSLA